jgi:hypothetical protein
MVGLGAVTSQITRHACTTRSRLTLDDRADVAQHAQRLDSNRMARDLSEERLIILAMN